MKRLCLFEQRDVPNNFDQLALKLFIPEFEAESFPIRRFGFQFGPTDASLNQGGFIQMTGAEINQIRGATADPITVRLASIEESQFMMS